MLCERRGPRNSLQRHQEQAIHFPGVDRKLLVIENKDDGGDDDDDDDDDTAGTIPKVVVVPYIIPSLHNLLEGV